MAPHALHPPGCIQFWEQTYDHALSLPTSAQIGKPASQLCGGQRSLASFYIGVRLCNSIRNCSMRHRSISRERPLTATICGAAGLLALLTANSLIGTSGASAESQKVRPVLSQAKLNPPLRSPEVCLRYSPDGTYLLLQ